MSLEYSLGKTAGLVQQARRLAPELLLQPFRRFDERCERDAGGDAAAIEHVEKIFGSDVARRGGCERTAADPADARVERNDAAFDGGPGIGDPGVPRVVEVAAPA